MNPQRSVILLEDEQGGLWANCPVSRIVVAMAGDLMEKYAPEVERSSLQFTDSQINGMMKLGYRVVIRNDNGRCVDSYE